MNALWILALLILISGVFSLAEMALASARRARLTQLAEAGDSGAVTALAIKDQPSRLLAASQTGYHRCGAVDGHLWRIGAVGFD